jgi:2-polyprenyl-3-methyl-5-hydroxy-6-metoxy-1,4-benzoquinol methylase
MSPAERQARRRRHALALPLSPTGADRLRRQSDGLASDLSVPSAMARFDFDDTFGDDYLHFYPAGPEAEHNQSEADEITDLLGVQPGEAVLDVPCGLGHIPNLLAARGIGMTGVDATPALVEGAVVAAATLGVSVDYRVDDVRALPCDGPFDE